MARGTHEGGGNVFYVTPKMKKGEEPFFKLVQKTEQGYQEVDRCSWIEGVIENIKEITLNKNSEFPERPGIALYLRDKEEVYKVDFYIDSFGGRTLINKLSAMTDFKSVIRLTLYTWTPQGSLETLAMLSVKQNGEKMEGVMSNEKMKSLVKKIKDGGKEITLTGDLDEAIHILFAQLRQRFDNWKDSSDAMLPDSDIPPMVDPVDDDVEGDAIPVETEKKHRGTKQSNSMPVQNEDDLPF